MEIVLAIAIGVLTGSGGWLLLRPRCGRMRVSTMPVAP